MIHERYYRLLGHYLYAIAASDGTLQDEEQVELEKLIVNELARKEASRHPGGSDVILAKLSFYSCLRAHMPVQEARHTFLEFLKIHGPGLSSWHRHTGLKLIRGVASAYKGINPTESGFVEAAEEWLQPDERAGKMM